LPAKTVRIVAQVASAIVNTTVVINGDVRGCRCIATN
jgi:hypothetical protein